MSRILVIGATGLVGKEICKQLEASNKVSQINILTRRPLPSDLKSSKTKEAVANFDQLDASMDCFAVDAVICSIGTTIKKAGSQDSFRKVDYEYPLKVASIAKRRGARGFYLVSALGADSSSRFFYNRVKGDLEKEIVKLNFESFVVARPSLLLGHRDESRTVERLSMTFAQYLPKQWRAIPVEAVAKSLTQSWEAQTKGTKFIENSELFKFL